MYKRGFIIFGVVSLTMGNSEVPPRYLVFFKAPDADAFNAAFKEYSASLLNKVNRPSVLEKLHELVQAAAELTGKVRHKEQERGL